jgi:hypothetical protein
VIKSIGDYDTVYNPEGISKDIEKVKYSDSSFIRRKKAK